jgi:hypothetical protein
MNSEGGRGDSSSKKKRKENQKRTKIPHELEDF